jgi:trimeric autotransporter adhesin
MDSVLDRTLKLQPVTYRMKSSTDSEPRNIGFIAQDLELLFPEVVSEVDGMKGVAYSELVPVAVGAIQELAKKVTAQEAELTELRAALTTLRTERQALAQSVSDQMVRLTALEEWLLRDGQVNSHVSQR